MRFAWTLVACLIGLAAAAQKPLTFNDSLHFYRIVLDTTTLVSDYQECVAKNITVFRVSDQKPLQTLKLDGDAFPCYWTEDEFFVVEDINFDGYNDIRLLQSMGARGNTSYLYWLYDRERKTFVRDTVYDHLTNPEFDRKHKRVHSFWSMGCCEYGTDTYDYVKGRLTLFEQETLERDEAQNDYVLTIKRRDAAGSMQVVEQMRMSRDEIEGDEEEDEQE